MSTRANIEIKFQDWEEAWVKKYKTICWIYNHHDWYVEWWLWDSLKKNFKSLRWDRDVLGWLAKVIEDWFNLQFTTCQHWDIDYLYTIYARTMTHANDESGLMLDVEDICTWDIMQLL